MKKKYYKKLSKKIKKLKKLVESNVKTTIINDWPQVLTPQPWEVTFNPDINQFVTTTN